MRRLSFLAALGLAVLIVLPALVVFPLAVSDSRFFEVTGFSTRWFASARSSFWISAAVLSLLLAASAATVATLTAATAVYYGSTTGRRNGSTILDVLAVTTLLVPPISLAVGYFRIVGESGAGVSL